MNAVILIIVLCFSIANDLFGKIKNGYERHLHTTRSALRALQLQLAAAGDMSVAERRSVKREIQHLICYISCYELTDELIRRIKTVSPGIFWEIDGIRDRRGRLTDVYVKLIPREKSRIDLTAATFIDQLAGDPDGSSSEYGPLSVSVDICIGNNALFLLSHEFGHIKYIIPNRAAYTQFYNTRYRPQNRVDLAYIGHGQNDQSGTSAKRFEKIYRRDKIAYARNSGRKVRSFLSLFYALKKSHRYVEGREEPFVVYAF